MQTLKQKTSHCRCCLTKNDLIQLTGEKQKIILSVLSLSAIKCTTIPKDAQICINCNSTLTYLDKFRHNCASAHKILTKSKLKNTFLSSVTDESVNLAFDTILNWMNDVTVIIKYLEDVKKEDGEEEEKEKEEVVEEQNFQDFETVLVKQESNSDTYNDDNTNTKFDTDDSSSSDDDYSPQNETETKNKAKKEKLKLSCQFCTRTFSKKSELIVHEMNHEKKNPFVCDVDGCTKAYPHPRTLKTHKLEIHGIRDGVKVTVPDPTLDDPKFLEKLEELKDENFDMDKYFAAKGSKRAYQCHICSRFYNKTEFQYHRNKHLGLKPFDCAECDKSFINPYELGKHIKKIHQADSSEDEEKNGSEGESKNRSVLYMDDYDPDANDDTGIYKSLEQFFVPERRGFRRSYKCPECSKIFSRGELKYHMNHHNNVKPYKCAVEYCEKYFESPRYMRIHCKKYHNVIVKPVKDYDMKNTRFLMWKERNDDQKDVIKHAPVKLCKDDSTEKLNVICTICGKSVRKKHFREHYYTHEKPDLKCPYEESEGCTAVFRNKMKLTSHIQAKHDGCYTPKSVANCMCELCGKTLTKAQLKYHMNLHLGLTPYACEYENCNLSYRSPNLLRQHIAGYHLKQKRFKCQYCSKRFNEKDDYDKHKNENCGVKTATCQYCGKSMNKFSLKNHLLIHTGEKNWVCEFEGCGKAFLRRDKLQSHKKVHSTENCFMCPYCTSGFKYKSWVDTHIEKKHPEKLDNTQGDKHETEESYQMIMSQ
uniref:CSON007137 protein n=1 Tax=Culicoides sonorensis TaxID=179676 RepID=A0A336LX45_CULSO